MKTYYTITRDGHFLRAESKAQAFEAWDCLGRTPVVEYHRIWEDIDGTMWHDVCPVKPVRRVPSDPDRKISYPFKYGNCTSEVISCKP